MRVHNRASFLQAQKRVKNLGIQRIKVSNELKDFTAAQHSIDHAIEQTNKRIEHYTKGEH